MWLWIIGVLFTLTLLFIIGLALWIWMVRRGFGRKGRIEGILYLGGSPAPAGQWVACHLSREAGISTRGSFGFIMWKEYTQTTEGGHFIFERIPIGEVELGQAFSDGKPFHRRFGGEPSSEAKADQEMQVVVKANETTTVMLGKDCLTLCGRFVFPDDIEVDIDWSLVNAPFLNAVNLTEPEPPKGLSSKEHAAWWEEFTKTEEGIAWNTTLHRMYHVRIESDGRFSIHNVYPGTYTLRARVDRPNSSDKDDSRRPLGFYENDIKVTTPSESSASVDLGPLTMTYYTPVEIGSSLPERIVRSVEGDKIDLVSFRGKSLLLYLWWDKKFQEKTFLQALAKLRHQFENAADVEILGLDMDPQDSNAYYWMTDIDAFFDHHDVVEEEILPLSAAFGVRETTLFLVAPAGEIVAIEDNPKAMRAPLKKLLEGVAHA